MGEELVDNLAAIASSPLDDSSQLPLYQQLKQRMLQLMASGSLDETTPLPTEMQLCQAFGLSRATVRRCFKDLVDEGRVVRRRGHGTFVRPETTRGESSVPLNFSSEMESAGLLPASRLLGLRRREASGGISRRLGVAEGTPVWEIRRLRLGNDLPLQLAIAYVPCELCPNLSEEDLTTSLYALISQGSGALPARAEESYEAVCLDAREAKALGVRAGSAALRVLRTSFDTTGRAFEASVLIEPGDRSRLVVSLSTEGTELRRVWG